MFALSNFLIAKNTVETTVLKHFFTCFSGKQKGFLLLNSYIKLSGIFLPGAVFFSKDNFHDKKSTMKMFARFARWNAFVFFWIGKEIL